MSGGTGANVEASADRIAARDVQEGRPGKTAAPAKWPWWAAVAGGAALVAGLLAFVLGLLFSGHAGGTVTPATPDNPVAVTPEKPETTTTSVSPSYNGPVQGQVVFVCSGNPATYPFNGQVQLVNGTFSLSSPQMSVFNGTVAASNLALNASGASGTLSGTLTSGSKQTLSLTTQDTGFPCIGGPYPFGFTLATPIDTTPKTSTGAPLSGVINPLQLAGNTPVGMDRGGINGPLVAVGGVLLVLGGTDLYLHRKSKNDEDAELFYEWFGYDYDEDEPPRFRINPDELNTEERWRAIPRGGDSAGSDRVEPK
jgi:hypothetical protein